MRNKFLFILVLILLEQKVLNASHFLGGSITAYPKTYSSTSVTMTIVTRFSWRLDYSSLTYCDSATISSGVLFGVIENIKCKKNCLTSNAIVGTTVIRCTAFSMKSLDNWSSGAYSFDYTFPLSSDIQISYSGSSWANLVIGGGSGWMIKLTINTLNRTDTGTVNSTPQTLIAPVIIIRQGFTYGFKIPYKDRDATDTIRCRWAESAKGECDGICRAVPFGVIVSDTCYFFINATAAVAGLYGAALQIEDFATSNSTTALSTVPLQFLINIKYINSSCVTSPTIVGDLPIDTCIVVNSNLTTRIVAKVSCLSINITDIQIMSETGVKSSNLIQLTTASWYKTMNWSPPQPIIGVNLNLICSTAYDSCLLASPSSCLTFITGIAEPRVDETTVHPTEIAITITDIAQIEQFNCSFNIDVIKPTASSFIRIFSSQTNLEVYSIDTSISNTTQFSSSRDMYFNIPVGSLPTDNYYILFDWGVAIFDQYCKPLTYPLTNISLWTFSITNTLTTLTYASSIITTSNSVILTSITTSSLVTNQSSTMLLQITNYSFNSNNSSNQSLTNQSSTLKTNVLNFPFCSPLEFCLSFSIALSICIVAVIALTILYLARLVYLNQTGLNKLKNKFKVHFEDETNPSLNPFCIMTIHDLGYDHTYFDNLKKCLIMSQLKDRIKWLNVDLPGQEKNAKDLKLKNYPTLIELADELSKILDCFHLDRVVCLGDGAGADISAKFAIMHPNRCLGLCLIRPNGNIASLNEQLSYLSNGLNDKINKAEAVFAYIVWQRFGLKVNENSID